MHYVIGVDPGKTGAVAIVSSNGAECEVWDLPDNEMGILDLQHDIVDQYGSPKAIYLESVHAMPKQGVTSSFNFGVSNGQARMFCALYRVRWVLITPQKWKKALGLGSDKEQSRILAQQLYPFVDLKLKKHHNRAEAILIGEYGRCEENRASVGL